MFWKSAILSIATLHAVFLGSVVAKVEGFSPVSSTSPSSVARCVPKSSLKSSENEEPKERVAVIVGGGPVGLATALTLSNPPHSYQCIVLEKTNGDISVAKYDASKAYLYNINPRGLEWVQKFPSILDKLFVRGSLTTGFGNFVRVPADPYEPIPAGGAMGIGRVDEADESQKQNPKENLQACSVWIPRHLMVQLLSESCKEQEERRQKDAKLQNSVGYIKKLLGKDFESVEPQHRGVHPLLVRCKDGSTFEADLVVGADGIDSGVRNCLANTNDDGSTKNNNNKDTWLQSRAKEFRVKRYLSPSAGIKIKCLQIVPNFKLQNVTSSIETNSETIYAIRSKNTGQGRLSLGMLPVKDPNLVRPANACVRHDHPLWSMTTGPEIKAYFEESFPRIKWRELIVGGSDPQDQGDTEWERFAKAKGTIFPSPQYSPGSAIWLPADDKEENQPVAGVVLVGDACHAFPPDIGQGINSGLQDVMALDRALKGQDIIAKSYGNKNDIDDKKVATPMPSLKSALAAYQTNRGPEHRALTRLARFGGPYQYNQSWPRDRIGKQLHTMNFLFRLLMNKITLGVFPPPCIVLTYQKPKKSGDPMPTFRQVMRRCDGATLAIKATLALAILLWAVKRFGLVLFPLAGLK